MMHDPQVEAWKMNSKGKLIDRTVEHLLKELSRAAWFFLERGGKISGNVLKRNIGISQLRKEDLKSC